MSHTHPYIIGITGGSASGKTTFLRKLAEAFGEHPVQLVADEETAADQIPALGFDTLVVVTGCGQAVLDGAICGDVHQR